MKENTDFLLDKLKKIERTLELHKKIAVEEEWFSSVVSKKSFRLLLKFAQWIKFSKKHDQLTTASFQTYNTNWESDDPITFPFVSKPDVSVIIVVWNKPDLTWLCLRSLAATQQSNTSFEVVLVDNFSNDSTRKMLHKVKNIRVIQNQKNVGFLKACNQAAAKIKGEFIYLLNNDAEVQNATISELHHSCLNSNIGAAGSKIILSSGLLQEAGSIIFRDGSALGYGRNEYPDADEFNFTRVVDFCSGASLMIKASLWKKIGGFDKIFNPAYYEETDLCMQLRNLGFSIQYVPQSQIIHREYSSSNATQAMELMKINRKKFAQKWSKQLIAHFEPSTSMKSVLFSRDAYRRPGCLIAVSNLAELEAVLYKTKHIGTFSKISVKYQLSFFIQQISMQHFSNIREKFGRVSIECISPEKTITELLKSRDGFYQHLVITPYFAHTNKISRLIALLKNQPQISIC